MFSLKRIGGEGTGNTTRTALAGYAWYHVSPVVCSQAGVASIYLFSKQISFELDNQNERVYCIYAISVLESGYYIDILFIPT